MVETCGNMCSTQGGIVLAGIPITTLKFNTLMVRPCTLWTNDAWQFCGSSHANLSYPNSVTRCKLAIIQTSACTSITPTISFRYWARIHAALTIHRHVIIAVMWLGHP